MQRMAPSLALSLNSVPLPTTQIFVPSKVIEPGPATENVASTVPSLTRSSIMLLLPPFATQIFVPSKTIPPGLLPRGKLVIDDRGCAVAP
jgi:hypothetical protein